MVFPLIIFLYIYFAFLALWGVLFFVALYHMFRFAFRSLTSVVVVVIFIGVASLMLNASWSLIKKIDWQEPIVVIENVPEMDLPL